MIKAPNSPRTALCTLTPAWIPYSRLRPVGAHLPIACCSQSFRRIEGAGPGAPPFIPGCSVAHRSPGAKELRLPGPPPPAPPPPSSLLTSAPRTAQRTRERAAAAAAGGDPRRAAASGRGSAGPPPAAPASMSAKERQKGKVTKDSVTLLPCFYFVEVSGGHPTPPPAPPGRGRGRRGWRRVRGAARLGAPPRGTPRRGNWPRHSFRTG